MGDDEKEKFLFVLDRNHVYLKMTLTFMGYVVVYLSLSIWYLLYNHLKSKSSLLWD